MPRFFRKFKKRFSRKRFQGRKRFKSARGKRRFRGKRMGHPRKQVYRQFLADASFIKLRFEYSLSINPTVGATDKTIGFALAGNSLETITAGTTITALNNTTISQNPSYYPTGLNTMCNQYGKYKVFGSKITMRILPGSNAAAPPANPLFAYLIPVNSAATVPQNVDVLSQWPYASKRLITPALLTSPHPIIIKKYMSTRKIEGITKAEFEAAGYLATTGGSASGAGIPPLVWDWVFQLNDFTATNLPTTDALCIHLSVVYYTKFYNKFILAAT